MATPKPTKQPESEVPTLKVEDSVEPLKKPEAKPVKTTEVNGMVIEDY